MKYDEASRLYFANNPQSAKTLKNIMRWNPMKTVAQNARQLHVQYHTARAIADRFRLRFQDVDLTKLKLGEVDKLSKMGYTYEQIGKLYDVSRQRVGQLVHYWRKKKKKRKGVACHETDVVTTDSDSGGGIKTMGCTYRISESGGRSGTENRQTTVSYDPRLWI